MTAHSRSSSPPHKSLGGIMITTKKRLDFASKKPDFAGERLDFASLRRSKEETRHETPLARNASHAKRFSRGRPRALSALSRPKEQDHSAADAEHGVTADRWYIKNPPTERNMTLL